MFSKLYLYFFINIIKSKKYCNINLKYIKSNNSILNSLLFNLKLNFLSSIKLNQNNKLNYLLKISSESMNRKNFVYLSSEKFNLLSYFNDLYSFYKKNFINDINLKLLNNNFFYNVSKFKYNRTSILLSFFFKNNFLNIVNFIFKSSFLNINPYFLAENTINYNCSVFNNYNYYNYNYYHYFIFINPSLKIINSNLNTELISISISDSLINNLKITYPIFVNEINEFTIYFFFCLYIQIYLIGKNLNTLYYSLIYKNYKKLILLKEYLNLNQKK